jgi:hypothetical protein
MVTARLLSGAFSCCWLSPTVRGTFWSLAVIASVGFLPAFAQISKAEDTVGDAVASSPSEPKSEAVEAWKDYSPTCDSPSMCSQGVPFTNLDGRLSGKILSQQSNDLRNRNRRSAAERLVSPEQAAIPARFGLAWSSSRRPKRKLGCPL